MTLYWDSSGCESSVDPNQTVYKMMSGVSGSTPLFYSSAEAIFDSLRNSKKISCQNIRIFAVLSVMSQYLRNIIVSKFSLKNFTNRVDIFQRTRCV